MSNVKCQMPNAKCQVPNQPTLQAASPSSGCFPPAACRSSFIVHRSSFTAYRSSFAVLCSAFVWSALLCSFGSLWGREIGNPAWADGPDAVTANPALLAAAHQPLFSYRILGLEVGAGNNSFSLAQYNRFDGAFLDDAAKQEILGSIPASGLHLNSDAQVEPLGLRLANFGLSARAIAGVVANLPRDVFDLALNGNELNRQYSASTLGGDAIAYSDVTLAAGILLPAGFAAGVGLKYLHGWFVAQTGQTDGYLLTTPSVINSEVNSVYRWATGGDGYGLDLGGTYDTGRWRFGLALLNLNLGINWTQGVQTGVLHVALDSFNLSRIRNPDAASIDNVQNPAAPFRTQLPAYISLGASYEPWHFLTVGADVCEGTATTALSSTVPRAGVKAEFRGLRWLPLSVDAAIGGNEGLTVGAGAGLNLKRFLLQARLANTQGVITGAQGLCVGLNLTYNSQTSEELYENPSILNLRSGDLEDDEP